uniref:Uncharacterized protein n=1 Tax=Tanacetum cinerariifolium TaxID=118510 RepID=A0A699IJT5_TANCI|nr:hypothetical protein [Tanacetum cinerariifolium]
MTLNSGSYRVEGALNIKELFSICTNLSNKVLALEIVKDAQAAGIIALKARIKKLEKRCKPSISHHRAWLKSVHRLSMKKMFGKKESISKQGRKKDKPTLDDSTLDDLDADHGIDIEEPMNRGRLCEETKELVSTARPGDSIVRLDVGTADPITKLKKKGVSIKDIEDSLSLARSILTLKPLPTIDPKDKGKGVLKVPEPTKKITRSDLDAAQMAKDAEVARLVYEEESTELKREKGEKIEGRRCFYGYEEREVDYEVLDKRFPIISWESKFYHLDRYEVECTYYKIFRSDGSSRWIKTFFEMVTRFDRMDLEELYNLVMQRFETTTPEGVDLVLWGDLRTIFEETAEDDLWKNQEEWIKSWNFYENYRVHTLTLEDGTGIYMLAERRYLLTKETLERMLAFRLIAECESKAIFDLLRFI